MKYLSGVKQITKSYLEDEELESISVDKMTLEDRVRWVNENMTTLQEMGKGKEIQTEAEKVYLFLSLLYRMV